MVLISPEALQRLNTPVQTSNVDTIENDMNKILYDPQMEDRTKWGQYQQMLQRRQFFHDQMRQPTEIPIIEKYNTNKSTPKFEEEILRTLPKAFKNKGELLFNRLCCNEIITWDSNGTVSINGSPLVGSNIVDLVCDVVRCKKSGGPVGWKHFVEALRQINIPQEFIGNPQRRQQQLPQPSSPRPVFPTLNARRRMRILAETTAPRRSRTWSRLSLH